MRALVLLIAVCGLGGWAFLWQERKMQRSADEIERLKQRTAGLLRIAACSSNRLQELAEEEKKILRETFGLSRRLFAIRAQWQRLREQLKDLEPLMAQAEDLIKRAEDLLRKLQ